MQKESFEGTMCAGVWLTWIYWYSFSWIWTPNPDTCRPVARGGSGGSYDPPQLPIPKILFHPLAILFHLSAILFHPLAILFHPSAILFHPFVPPFMWMTSHGQCPRGGVLVNVQDWGRFSNWWRHADNVQGGGGGAPGVPPIQVQTPPTWLAGYGPAHVTCRTTITCT